MGPLAGVSHSVSRAFDRVAAYCTRLLEAGELFRAAQQHHAACCRDARLMDSLRNADPSSALHHARSLHPWKRVALRPGASFTCASVAFQGSAACQQVRQRLLGLRLHAPVHPRASAWPPPPPPQLPPPLCLRRCQRSCSGTVSNVPHSQVAWLLFLEAPDIMTWTEVRGGMVPRPRLCATLHCQLPALDSSSCQSHISDLYLPPCRRCHATASWC